MFNMTISLFQRFYEIFVYLCVLQMGDKMRKKATSKASLEPYWRLEPHSKLRYSLS